MTDIAGTLPPGKERKVKAQQPYDIGNSKQKKLECRLFFRIALSVCPIKATPRVTTPEKRKKAKWGHNLPNLPHCA